MIKMLDRFNLYDEFERPLTDLTLNRSFQRVKTNTSDFEEIARHFIGEESKDKDDVRDRGNEILSFLGDIYEPCRRNIIKSTDIIKWIQDLLVNFSSNDISEIIIDRSTRDDNSSIRDEPIQIPLITQVNTFLEGKNQQYFDLRNRISELIGDLNDVSKKITQKSEDLKNIEEREKVTLQFLNWYNNLRYSLKNNSEIGIEQVIDDFVRMINEFKDYNFDAIEFIKDYRKMKSLNGEIIDIQSEININLPRRESLQAEIQEQSLKLMQINQALTIYRTLESMGFGLKELKFLSCTAREIAVANNMKVEEAVKKFLDDVEKDYDNKLGFEIAINKLASKKMQLDKELPLYRGQALQQMAVNASLDYVKDNGVSDSDIIGMSKLVRFIGNILLSNYADTKVVGDNPWHFFIQDITRIKNLKLEIKTLLAFRDNLKKEITTLHVMKPPSDAHFPESALDPNSVDTQTYQDDLEPN